MARTGGSALPNPLPGAEDFSFVLDEVPGVFLFLGATPRLGPGDRAVQPLSGSGV